MKKTKKFLALIMATILLLNLVACGSDSTESTTTYSDNKDDDTHTSEDTKDDRNEEESGNTTTYDTSSDNSADKEDSYNKTEDVAEENDSINNPNESYAQVDENEMIDTRRESTSTFSIDVDTASYSNIRRILNSGSQPSPDAVRIEEMLNYFDYDFPEPEGDLPFSITTSTTFAPWKEENLVTMIGMNGMEISDKDLPPSNIVLLIDVSGSMGSPEKLPLLKDAFKHLVENFTDHDRVSIVVYAGAAGVVLDGEEGSNYNAIADALDSLKAGGSTAGGEGIELAYNLANDYFIRGGNNRVILATDGDFNVGINSLYELEEFIAEKREDDIFLSVIGFGTGNIKDDTMELLADKGNGNYAYIDSYDEAVKVFSKEFSGTMFAIAKDVKIQVEFNEDIVESYRLIGYENRVMNNEDFEDDTKDAGELGAGHQVVALYEIELVDPDKRVTGSMYEVKLRYKDPDSDTSKGIQVVEKVHEIYTDPYGDENILWALAVAEFGMILKDSRYQGDSSLERVYDEANYCANRSNDEYKEEFVDIVFDYLDTYGDSIVNSGEYETIYIDE